MSREKAQSVLTAHFGEFGALDFPYVKMGNIDSLHLFGDTELMILAIYLHNRKRWRTAVDIGANLGLHSICMSRLGWNVRAYEPDPYHFPYLVRNLDANGAICVQPYMAAVHTYNGSAQFVRVLDNLTGNHLAGFKDSYGPRETVLVPVVDCRPLWEADFAKIDSEGNEAELVCTMQKRNFNNLSAVLEVRNQENAKQIYEYLSLLEVPMWSQKRDWNRVLRLEDMPKANREGSLFIGHEAPFA